MVKRRINKILIISVAISLLFGFFYLKTSAREITQIDILADHFDVSIPGFSICSELRRLTEALADPSVTPPYEVGLFSVDQSTSDSGSNIDDGGSGGSTPTINSSCSSCVNLGRYWCDAGGGCWSNLSTCNLECSGNCISSLSSCPSDTSSTDDGSSSGGYDQVTVTQGSLFQKWFLDACVMDGYLTEVRHVATMHNFDIEESLFAEKMGKNEANLGELFAETFMKATRAMEDGKRVKKEDLEKETLKDFFLVLKDSHEQFMTDLMTAIAEKEKLSLDRLKEYELAKIEKAREDVNKLTYEVYRELIEEPLVYDKELTRNIVRSLGLSVIEEEGGNCPFGVLVDIKTGDGTSKRECVIIKKEGRVIQNVDDFIYEEALQKARDFIMCFFAPERHFPIGEDYYFAASKEEFTKIKQKTADGYLRDGTNPNYVWQGDPVCGSDVSNYFRKNDCNDKCIYDSSAGELLKSSDWKKIQECRNCIREKLDERCNTQYICEQARIYANTQTGGMGRPDMFSEEFEAYKNNLCPSDQIKEKMKEDMLFALARKYKFIYQGPPENWYYRNSVICPLILGNLGYDVDGLTIAELSNPLRSNTIKAYQDYQEQTWGTALPIAVAYRPDATDKDYNLQNQSLTSSTGFGIQSYVENIIGKIISDYQSLRTAEYVAGEGLRSEKYLIGFPALDGKGNSLGYYFIDTENVISPALFLKEKVAAATQAQFDLAQMAFKQHPEGPFGEEEMKCPDPQVAGDYSLNEQERLVDQIDAQDLEHGWYLTTIIPPEGDPYKMCIFPQFNDITGSVFGEIRKQPEIDINKINELPAPWEDFGEYMKIPEEYKDWFDGTLESGLTGEEAGLRKAPPAFNMLDQFSQVYGDPKDHYSFYDDAYVDDISWPQRSDDYYINKWYTGVTQLYNKPMSEILRTWFKPEATVSSGAGPM